MDAYYIFDNFKEQLTDKERKFIETSDQIAIKDFGTFKSLEDFKEFVKEISEE